MRVATNRIAATTTINPEAKCSATAERRAALAPDNRRNTCARPAITLAAIVLIVMNPPNDTPATIRIMKGTASFAMPNTNSRVLIGQGSNPTLAASAHGGRAVDTGAWAWCLRSVSPRR